MSPPQAEHLIAKAAPWGRLAPLERLRPKAGTVEFNTVAATHAEGGSS